MSRITRVQASALHLVARASRGRAAAPANAGVDDASYNVGEAASAGAMDRAPAADQESERQAILQQLARKIRRAYRAATPAQRAAIRAAWRGWRGPRSIYFLRYVVDVHTGGMAPRRDALLREIWAAAGDLRAGQDDLAQTPPLASRAAAVGAVPRYLVMLALLATQRGEPTEALGYLLEAGSDARVERIRNELALGTLEQAENRLESLLSDLEEHDLASPCDAQT